MRWKLNCQGRWVAQARVIWFSERGVIGSQRPGDFCLFVFFSCNWKNGLKAYYRITTTISNHYHPPSQPRASRWHNYEEEARGKSGQDKDRGGVFCHSEGQRDRREDQGEKKWKDEEGAVGSPPARTPLPRHTSRMHNKGISWNFSQWDDRSLSWCMPQALWES